MEFSTLNESSLHKSLKTLYAEIYNGKTEVAENGHIYDIVTKNNNVIEIQTKNLSKLLGKVQDSIDKGYNVKIVHPVIINKRIHLYNSENKRISNRKSPSKGSIYDIFDELTGVYPVLLNPHFSLEIVEVEIIEERIRTEENVQSKNNRRRFKKNWNKTNKILESIINTRTFNSKYDYLNLLPRTLPEEFCAKDLSKELLNNKNIPQKVSKKAHLIIWVLFHMEIITKTKTENKSRYYKIT